VNKRKLENMGYLFDPRSVAVVGASPNPAKLGFHVMKSLVKGGFGGQIVPINPSVKEIMGIKVFTSLEKYMGNIDLAIVVVPAKSVREVFIQCKKKGVRGVGRLNRNNDPTR